LRPAAGDGPLLQQSGEAIGLGTLPASEPASETLEVDARQVHERIGFAAESCGPDDILLGANRPVEQRVHRVGDPVDVRLRWAGHVSDALSEHPNRRNHSLVRSSGRMWQQRLEDLAHEPGRSEERGALLLGR
jgi:hypothetical protein